MPNLMDTLPRPRLLDQHHCVVKVKDGILCNSENDAALVINDGVPLGLPAALTSLICDKSPA
jgi:hypothetical protein